MNVFDFLHATRFFYFLHRNARSPPGAGHPALAPPTRAGCHRPPTPSGPSSVCPSSARRRPPPASSGSRPSSGRRRRAPAPSGPRPSSPRRRRPPCRPRAWTPRRRSTSCYTGAAAAGAGAG
eukprot:gene3674-biopygen21795